MWGFSGCLATLNYCLGLGPKPGPFSTSQLLGQVFGFRTKEPARKAETFVLCVSVCVCVLGVPLCLLPAGENKGALCVPALAAFGAQGRRVGFTGFGQTFKGFRA